MERDFCLREKLHNLGFHDNYIETQALILLGCRLCKKDFRSQIGELLETKADKTKDGISRYEFILLWPFLMAMNPDPEIHNRIGDAIFLRALAGLDPEDTTISKDETISKFESIRNNSPIDSIELLKFVNTLPLLDYCCLVAALYMAGDLPWLFRLAISFWSDRTYYMGSGGGRINLYFRENENDYFLFCIGVSLNEGLVETMTVLLMNQDLKELAENNTKKRLEIDFNDPNRFSDAYYFEMMFFRRICSVLKVDFLEIVRDLDSDLIYMLLKSNTKNLCNVYAVLRASDDLDWILAEDILDKWTE